MRLGICVQGARHLVHFGALHYAEGRWGSMECDGTLRLVGCSAVFELQRVRGLERLISCYSPQMVSGMYEMAWMKCLQSLAETIVWNWDDHFFHSPIAAHDLQ